MSVRHQAAGLAGLMRFLRVNTGRRGSLQMVEVLAAVGAGADTVQRAAEASGCSVKTVRRHLDTLRGRGAVRLGNQKPSQVVLIDTFWHPHIKGAIGLRLSATGAELLAAAFAPGQPSATAQSLIQP